MDFQKWLKDIPDKIRTALTESHLEDLFDLEVTRGDKLREALRRERGNRKTLERALKEMSVNLADLIPVQEAANVAQRFEALIHLRFTELADSHFAEGYLTREERIILSSAIGAALESFAAVIEKKAPHLLERKPWTTVPGPGQGATTQTTTGEVAAEGDQTKESEFRTDPAALVLLEEAAVSADGFAQIKIITPGWGSTGYYSPEVIKRDGPKIFKEGLQMYWDHPTATEDAERPERSLRDLAAVLSSKSEWQEAGPEGPGLYAAAKVYGAYRHPVNEMGKDIGVSIRAMGMISHGQAEGREGPIIQELTAAKSVDFVTLPGRGGSVVQMFESFRNGNGSGKNKLSEITETTPGDPAAESDNPGAGSAPINPSLSKESDMSFKDIAKANARILELESNAKTLTEAAAVTEAENARHTEADLFRQTAALVTEKVTAVENLPQMTATRIVENLKNSPVLDEDGKLDTAKMEEKIDEALKAELEYLQKMGVSTGAVIDLGESTNPLGGEDLPTDEDMKALDEELAESLAAIAGQPVESDLIKTAVKR